jgi:hypothetical protein
MSRIEHHSTMDGAMGCRARSSLDWHCIFGFGPIAQDASRDGEEQWTMPFE